MVQALISDVLYTVAHLAWKKGVCRGRAAFDITFQHKTALSLKIRNRSMNFAMLPKYYIGKIRAIYSTVYWQYLLMKAITLVFSTGCSETKLLLRLWLTNANSLYCSLRRAAVWLHQVVRIRNIWTAPQSSLSTGLWNNIRSQVLCGEQMAACEQSRDFDYLSDPGLRRIPC